MRYENLPQLEQHLKEAAASRFLPLYLILGKESYECEEAVQLLTRSLLPMQQDRAFALHVFDGVQADEGEIINLLYSAGSFFVKFQVILIKQAEKLKKSVQEKLEKYLSESSNAITLVICATSWHKGTSFFKAADTAGAILEFAELKPWEKEKRLSDWVSKRALAVQKLMPYPVCQQLVHQIGHDQALIAQELEKLFCYCGERKNISSQDVKTICSHLNNESIWQLGEAIFKRESAVALHAAQGMLEDGQPLLPLLRQIRTQFVTDYQVSLLLEQGKQGQEITAQFPYMKGKILDQHIRQASQYGGRAFKEGLLALETAEMRIKNSGIAEEVILELLIMQLTAPNK